jgi:hypothetical protein
MRCNSSRVFVDFVMIGPIQAEMGGVFVADGEAKPNMKIEFISPDKVRKIKRKRLTPEQAGIQPRLEHLYAIKALIEKLFGPAEFLKIKMGGSMSDWRKAGMKLLDAIELAVKSTAEVADSDWFEEVATTTKNGKERVQKAETIDSLLSHLVAVLAELVFIQLGNFPLHRPLHKTTPLTRDWWTLTGYRSVQYVQSNRQKRAQADLNAKRAESAKRASAAI